MDLRSDRTFILATLIFALSACRGNRNQDSAPPAARATNESQGPSDAPAASPPAAGIEPPAAASEFRDAAQVLPQGEVAGWRQSGQVIRSTAANLSQLIDGAAALFEQYGVRHYAKTEYRRAGTTLVATAEVYEFAAPLGAFGRYTRMLADGRDPATMQPQGIQRGGGGYQGTTQVTFWKGRYLVQVSIGDESEEPNEALRDAAAREALPRFAEAIDRLVQPEGPMPVAPLPQEGMVWGGTVYYADQVLGVEGTGPGWTGYYLHVPSGGRYRLAVMSRESPAAAQALLARFRAPGASNVAGLGDEAFALRESPNGQLVAMRRENTVYVLADGGAPNLRALPYEAALDVLRGLIAARPTVAPAVSATSAPPRAPARAH